MPILHRFIAYIPYIDDTVAHSGIINCVALGYIG